MAQGLTKFDTIYCSDPCVIINNKLIIVDIYKAKALKCADICSTRIVAQLLWCDNNTLAQNFPSFNNYHCVDSIRHWSLHSYLLIINIEYRASLYIFCSDLLIHAGKRILLNYCCSYILEPHFLKNS